MNQQCVWQPERADQDYDNFMSSDVFDPDAVGKMSEYVQILQVTSSPAVSHRIVSYVVVSTPLLLGWPLSCLLLQADRAALAAQVCGAHVGVPQQQMRVAGLDLDRSHQFAY